MNVSVPTDVFDGAHEAKDQTGPTVSAARPRLISVLTPLYHVGAQFLEETWESLRAQTLPDGFAFEWVVQEDAPASNLKDVLFDVTGNDFRVVYDFNGRFCGQAVSRTMAFQRSHGFFVYALDQDDVLLPGALNALVTKLSDDPRIMWATGRTQRLFEDGTVVERQNLVDCGHIPAGRLVRLFETGVETAFYPTATMFRRWALQMLGAWPALVTAEDAALQLAMSAAFDGFCVDHLLLSRRKWAEQAVESSWHRAHEVSARQQRYVRALAIDEARRAGLFKLPDFSSDH